MTPTIPSLIGVCMHHQPKSSEEILAEPLSANTPRYPRERLVETGITAHGQVVLQLNQARRELNAAHVRLTAQQAAMLVIGMATEFAAITGQDHSRETISAVLQGCVEALTAYGARHLKAPDHDTPRLSVTEEVLHAGTGGRQ